MPDENKRNVHYFEAESMSALFASLQAWQNETDKRFLSVAISEDHSKFCCIALTNPPKLSSRIAVAETLFEVRQRP